MHILLHESNIIIFTKEQLTKAYESGDLQIMCVDGRSIDTWAHNLIINCPGGEFGLYAMLLVALQSTSGVQWVETRHRIVENKLFYAHSDSHVHHGDGSHGDDFHCGCGHINLLMSKSEYGLHEHLQLLQSLYPSKPDILHGDHKESSIIISKVNETWEYITLKSNNNQSDMGLENDEQVFLYDEDAIKALIDHLSENITSRYDTWTDNQTLAQKRKETLDQHTQLTVTKFLKPAVSLVEQWELYYLILKDHLPVLTKLSNEN